MPIKSKKYLSVRYSIVNDVYEQIDKEGSVIQQVKGWQHGIYKSKDIFRKHEFDWNCVYLARLGKYPKSIWGSTKFSAIN